MYPCMEDWNQISRIFCCLTVVINNQNLSSQEEAYCMQHPLLDLVSMSALVTLPSTMHKFRFCWQWNTNPDGICKTKGSSAVVWALLLIYSLFTLSGGMDMYWLIESYGRGVGINSIPLVSFTLPRLMGSPYVAIYWHCSGFETWEHQSSRK